MNEVWAVNVLLHVGSHSVFATRLFLDFDVRNFLRKLLCAVFSDAVCETLLSSQKEMSFEEPMDAEHRDIQIDYNEPFVLR
ncbi:hypothetical protein DPMN_114460 [Dreissena polymorpha]|uniref:Uncharacterized protein n=1 Tax=Dreissena polymorpha TaxID=45954 RepID=A0A9D4KKL7_DREPO|nr:hypothetical protein DPMN_114460 [Dreissena polymorpha]